jgi:hypothetical protein
MTKTSAKKQSHFRRLKPNIKGRLLTTQRQPHLGTNLKHKTVRHLSTLITLKFTTKQKLNLRYISFKILHRAELIVKPYGNFSEGARLKAWRRAREHENEKSAPNPAQTCKKDANTARANGLGSASIFKSGFKRGSIV